MTDRVQLNLRLDGKRELLETIKEVAAAAGLSVNAWVIRTLEQATNTPNSAPTVQTQEIPRASTVSDIELLLDTMLDNKLATKLASFEERLGKLRA
jgi:hypothetical protein